MATANFHARIERIQRAQAKAVPKRRKRGPIRQQPLMAEHAAQHTLELGKRSKPMARLLLPMSVGASMGVVGGLALLGATTEGWMWGPGTPLNPFVLPVGIGGLALAALLMFAALIKGGDKPGLSFLALSYLSGFMLMLLV